MTSDAPVLEPDLPIVDPHHHLFDRPGLVYRLDDLLDDLACGHDVRSTVYVQCDTMYRTDGPDHLKPVGEAEFVAAMAEEAALRTGGRTAVCAAMSGYADLRRGKAVDDVLAALAEAAKGRLRGIRHIACFDPDNIFGAVRAAPGLLLEPGFREGYSRLSAHGLLFEGWLYHTQLGDLLDLARSFPETAVVLNHIGAPLRAGTYEGRREEVFAEWSQHMSQLAACPNVVVKVGGFGMHLFGFDFEKRDPKPGYREIAEAWRPFIETCIELFGVERCMFESNFPVDRPSIDYRTLWNAFKQVAAGYSDAEKAALFNGTASRVYGLPLPGRA